MLGFHLFKKPTAPQKAAEVNSKADYQSLQKHMKTRFSTGELFSAIDQLQKAA